MYGKVDGNSVVGDAVFGIFQLEHSGILISMFHYSLNWPVSF
jgi:hypothetical protein